MKKETFAVIVRRLRIKGNVTQRELANKLDITVRELDNWEREVGVPNEQQLEQIASIFGVTVDDLLGVEDEKDSILDEKVVRFMIQSYHKVLLPVLIVLCVFSYVVFWLFRENWTTQLLVGILGSLLLIIVMFTIQIRKRRRLWLVLITINMVIIVFAFIIGESYFGYLGDTFFHVTQSASSQIDMDEGDILFFENQTGDYRIVFKKGESHFFVYNLFESLSEMEQSISTGIGVTDNLFVYKNEVYLSTHSTNSNNELSTIIYKLNENLNQLVEVAQMDGEYNVYGGFDANHCYLIPVLSESEEGLVYEMLPDGAIQELTTIDYQIYDYVYYNGMTYVSTRKGAYSKIVSIDENFNVNFDVNVQVMSEQPFELYMQGGYIFALNDVEWLYMYDLFHVVGITEYDKHKPQHPGLELAYINGGIFDEYNIPLSKAVYLNDQHNLVSPEYLVSNYEGTYFGIDSEGITLLERNNYNQPLIDDELSRFVLFITSSVVLPTTMVLGMKKKKM